MEANGSVPNMEATVYTIEVLQWSGAVRPWRAMVFLDGKRIGVSGANASEGRALAAGERIVAAHKRGLKLNITSNV